LGPRSGRLFWSRRSAQRFCVQQFEVTGAYLRWEAASASIGLARVAQLGRHTRTQLTCLRMCNAHTCTIIGIRSRCTDRHGSSPEQDTPRCSPWPQPLRCWSATTSSKSEVLAHQSPRPPSAELGCSALFSKGFPDGYTCRGVDWLLFRLPKENAIEVLAGVPFRIRPCKAAHKQVT